MVAVGRPLTDLTTLQALVPSGPVKTVTPRRMEDLGALYGFALYEATLPAIAKNASGDVSRWLKIAGGARDRVIALIDSKPVAKMWRGDVKGCAEGLTLNMPPASSEAPERLQLLVEITGRLAYGIQMQGDALRGKGLVGCSHNAPVVTLDDMRVPGPGGEWTQWVLPLDSAQLQRWPNVTGVEHTAMAVGDTTEHAPQLFEGSFRIAAGDVADCWVDMAGWFKGTVSINGVDLGRYWCRGPRSSLYIAAPLLRQGDNRLRVLELEPTRAMATGTQVQLRDAPSLATHAQNGQSCNDNAR